MQLRTTIIVLLVGAALALKPIPRTNKPAQKADDDDDKAKWMLPTNVVPDYYNLTLMTHMEKFNESDPDSFTFDGIVEIHINVTEDVPAIVLHSSDTTKISSVTLLVDGENDATPLAYTYDTETNKLTLMRNDGANVTIPKQMYTLSITYTGVHGDDMRGFYRSVYTNEKSEVKWLITTQFEAYDARRAFPCFDEPMFKAKYEITIHVHQSIVEQGYGVLSNMPLTDDGPITDSNTGMVQYKFKLSEKKISSYLVAFIVSDFNATTPATFEDGKKQFRTYGQSRYILSGEGATSQLAGPGALDAIRSLTGVDFGYPKVDQVGIPDFNAGAMENWGLVTYRERMIFFNESKNPTSQKQSVVTVTAHELGHQWFGDLVTLHWWSDIWLNEGFATFFEYHATDKIRMKELNTSTWKIVNQMVVDELQAGAFAVDAQPNSRPLTKPVYRPGDIDANFDDVAYSKGGSVIRMWMHALGEKNFYNALHSYLMRNQESVGTPESLLEEFDAVVGAGDFRPIEDFADWHQVAGYPVLTVKRINDTFHLEQERFLVSGEDPANSTWTLPITSTTNIKPNFEETMPSGFFKKNNTNYSITPSESPQWIIFNIQQTGFYRVNYDEAGWQALTNALLTDHTVIHEINRAQLLDDVLWLARASRSYTSYDVALNLTMYLTKEKELIPWKSALNNFNFLYGKMATNATNENNIRQHILGLLKDRFMELSLMVREDDSHTDRLLRSQIASWACKLRLDECVQTAQTLFNENILTKDGEGVHPDVKSTVLCTNVRQGDAQVWDQVWAMYQNTADNAEQTQYLSALGCALDSEVLNNYLKMTLEKDSGIRKQDLTAVFSAVYNGNPENVQIALQFLKDNLTEIAHTYGGMDPLGGLLTGIAAKLGTEEDVKVITELSDYIAASNDTNIIAARTGALAAVDIVKSNKAWLDQKQDEIAEWLAPKYSAGPANTAATLLALIVPSILALLFAH